jgi:hypothetical protein
MTENHLKDKRFYEKLFGKLFEDKGYIPQNLFEQLFVREYTSNYENQEEHEKCLNASL